MKLCLHNNTEVTYTVCSGTIIVTFEQVVGNELKTATFDEYANMLINRGFCETDLDYFKQFTERNINVIKEFDIEGSQ